jgi:glycine/D-amino acid oxidase-like deaminating enzyme
MPATTPDPLSTVEKRSLWQAQAPTLPDRSGRPLPDAADLVVVGGGYTGLSAARKAARLRASVVLLEAERLGWGASTRNAGFCHPGYKSGAGTLLRRYGDAIGRRLYADSVEAVAWTERTIAADGIAADWDGAGYGELAYAPAHVEDLTSSVEALRSVGMAARYVPRSELASEIAGDAYYGALVVESGGGLHPGRYHAGIAEGAARAGADLHEGVRAHRIRRQADGRSVVETSRGAILAREVFIGTNGYPDGLVPALRRRVLSIGSFIVATEPLSEDLARMLHPTRRMWFDSKEFLYYWRLTPDRRMLFGGRASMWPASIERTARILARAMVAIHPELAGVRIAYAWGGRVALTLDRMPHVGRAGGAWYATGCCGSGVALLPWLGERVAGWILGGEDAPTLARLRFPLVPAPYEGRAWFLPVAGEWWKTRDRLAARSRGRTAARPRR